WRRVGLSRRSGAGGSGHRDLPDPGDAHHSWPYALRRAPTRTRSERDLTSMARAGCEARTEELLAAISGKRLLCFGDVMLDRFVHGRVERISPEAPIPVLSIEGEWETPGSGANVARNAPALGAHAELLGVVGEDDAGERLSRLLAENGISADLLVQPGERTTVKTRFLSGGHQLLRVDRDGRDIELATAMRLLGLAEKSLGNVDAVVLSD